jgi:hypothetical protein
MYQSLSQTWHGKAEREIPISREILLLLPAPPYDTSFVSPISSKKKRGGLRRCILHESLTRMQVGPRTFKVVSLVTRPSTECVMHWLEATVTGYTH